MLMPTNSSLFLWYAGVKILVGIPPDTAYTLPWMEKAFVSDYD